MKTSPDTDITTRARELYREWGPRVDTATAARLRAARRTALEQGTAPRRPLRWMVPAGAFAAAVLALVVNWSSLPPQHAAPVASHVAVTDEQALPPDADQTDPALYQDMDFYAWLAEQPRVASRTAHP